MTGTQIIRLDIQALRGISVLAVILFHLRPDLFPNGFLGVDAFFVISGFVITPLILKIFITEVGEKNSNKVIWHNLRTFYTRRFYRLAPALGISVGIFVPLLILFGDYSLPKRLLSQGFASLIGLGNIGAYKFSGDYFNPGIPNPLVHTWSLSVEEQIYIFIPMSLLLFLFLIRRNIKIKFKIFYISITLTSLILTLYPKFLISIYTIFFAVPSSFLFYSPISRIWEFGLGGIATFLISTNRNLKSRVNSFTNILMTVILIFILFNLVELNATNSVFMTTAVISLIIYLKVNFRAENKIFTWLIWLGNRSYSLYLVHLPIIYLLTQSPYVRELNVIFKFVLELLCLVSILIVGHISFERIESKFRFQRKSGESGGSYSLLRIVSRSILAPGMVLVILFIASSSQYFGLAKSTGPQNDAANFQKYCIRDSFVRQFPCRFIEKGSSKTIILLGDSHAAQYALQLWKISKENDFNLIFGGNFGGPRDTPLAIGLVQKTKPEIVIVSKYWRSEGGKLSENVQASIRKFKQFSGKTLVVEQNPIYQINSSKTFPATFLNSFKQSTFNLGAEIVPIFRLDKDAMRGREVMLSFTKREQISSIDPFNVFCDELKCRRKIGNSWLYIDNNHLSASGARKVIPLFLQEIRGLN